MYNTPDLYLGTFLILSGFGLSLFNLRRVIKGTTFSSLLLSENVLLMCIGIAFVSRSVYSLNPTNMETHEMEKRTAELASSEISVTSCGFSSLLLGYGPLVVSLVNSFLTLIIDNYMHYRMLENIKEKADENVMRELGEDSERQLKYDFCKFWRENFSFVTIALQWLVPILTALAMYPVGVNEITMTQARSMDANCLAMLDLNNEECANITYVEDYASDLPKYIQTPVNFFEIQENESKSNTSKEIGTVLTNVLRIINNFNNHTNFTYTSFKSSRHPKVDEKCMKMCYTDNKSLLLYMFILAFVSYFIPITISTIILTKIHIMDVKKPNMKTYVTRELLYNILFWTPVMFDTFLSLIFCSYSTQGTRTSIFNTIANIYQAVKNFMNTKYFRENIIVPV